jgi:hypothetical protein
VKWSPSTTDSAYLQGIRCHPIISRECLPCPRASAGGRPSLTGARRSRSAASDATAKVHWPLAAPGSGRRTSSSRARLQAHRLCRSLRLTLAPVIGRMTQGHERTLQYEGVAHRRREPSCSSDVTASHRNSVRRTRHGRPYYCYCKATRIGIRPAPPGSARRAFPITAPQDFCGSSAFIAWPDDDEVVNRSPASTGAEVASTLQ